MREGTYSLVPEKGKPVTVRLDDVTVGRLREVVDDAEAHCLRGGRVVFELNGKEVRVRRKSGRSVEIIF